jgi:hypothetical protein
MPERIDTKAVLDGINAAIRGEGKPSAETLLAWWKALTQEIADHEADRKRLEALEDVRDADWRKFVHLRNDNERIRMLGEQLAAAEARNEALVQALPAKDAEGLARVCMSFAGEMLHKQDDIGQRFWTEQAKRLRGYAALAAKEKP